MNRTRCLHKGFAYKNKIFVFGGDIGLEEEEEDVLDASKTEIKPGKENPEENSALHQD